MGRKKSKRTKIKPKVVVLKLENRFDCPICNNENVVYCTINKTEKHGTAICTICETRYRTSVNNLDHPIDVYHSWIDSLN